MGPTWQSVSRIQWFRKQTASNTPLAAVRQLMPTVSASKYGSVIVLPMTDS